MVALPDHLRKNPVGNERIPDEVMHQHQRARVVAAAMEVFARHGYQRTTVDDLVKAGKIGVGSFYSLLGGKEECFVACYREAVELAWAEAAEAAIENETWAGKARAVLEAVLRRAASQPNQAAVVFVEAESGGSLTRGVLCETLAQVEGLLAEGREERAGDTLPKLFERAAIGGFMWLVRTELEEKEPDPEGLLEDALELVVAPYLTGGSPRRA